MSSLPLSSVFISALAAPSMGHTTWELNTCLLMDGWEKGRERKGRKGSGEKEKEREGREGMKERKERKDRKQKGKEERKQKKERMNLEIVLAARQMKMRSFRDWLPFLQAQFYSTS